MDDSSGALVLLMATIVCRNLHKLLSLSDEDCLFAPAKLRQYVQMLRQRSVWFTIVEKSSMKNSDENVASEWHLYYFQ